ncbi:hypothetical protein SAMD00019534_119240, partial [Acytostelium subglobosum LB1]|uniref:hypothetical protein n=1 Tax=Acytostelium subglobosum LB1 TaxID=1410327 RepID=UPI000644EE28
NIKLTEQQTYLVNTIKDSISDKSQLVIPNRNKCLELYTDASSIALGSTVNQRDDNGSLQLVAAFSRKLNESERMFTTTIRETMAIIETLKKYESMLIDSELLIKTDHLNITYLKDKQQLSPKEFRWLEYLNRFKYKIDHVDGNSNGAADALSRREDYESPLPSKYTDQIRTSSINNEFIQQLKDRRDTTVIDINGLSYLVEGEDRRLIITDKHIIQQLISEAHDSLYAGHFNTRKTYLRLRPYYIFRSMLQVIEHYCRSCHSCQRNQLIKKQSTLYPNSPADKPFDIISLDFLKLPKSKNGFVSL